jgi:hypothetical protein
MSVVIEMAGEISFSARGKWGAISVATGGFKIGGLPDGQIRSADGALVAYATGRHRHR